MSYSKLWTFLWITCLFACYFQMGSSLFLSHNKKSVLNYLVKSKLAKLHAALSDDYDHGYDVAHYHHYHYDPVPVIVVPHHGLYKSGHGFGHYLSDPWHLSHHSYHWGGHHHDY